MPRSRLRAVMLGAFLVSCALPPIVSAAASSRAPGRRAGVEAIRRVLGTELATLLSEYEAYGRERGDTAAAAFRPASRFVEVADGLVTLDLVADGDPHRLLADLARLGLRDAALQGRVVSGRLPIEALEEVAALSSLRFARAAVALPADAGRGHAADGASSEQDAGLASTTGAPLRFGRSGDAADGAPSGSVDLELAEAAPAPAVSQGDRAIRADIARSTFGLSGAGIRVGVIADTFDCAGTAVAAGIAAGELPADTVVLAEGPCPGTDRGRAIAETIHDVAPGAAIAFRSGQGGQAALAAAILALAADDGVDVLVEDVLYPTEPMFQDGIVAQAIDAAAAGGVAILSAAGDRGRRSHAEPFRSSGFSVLYGGDAHDFDPGPGVDVYQAITLPVDAEIVLTLQWDSPYFSVSGGGGSPNDLDICLMDEPPTTLIACGDSLNLGGDPVELLSFYNDGAWGTAFNLVIEKFEGPDPGWLQYVLLASGEPAEHFTGGPTLFGHANSDRAAGVAAAFYFDTPPFGTTPPLLRTTSSAGGVPIFHDLAGTRLPVSLVRPQPRFTGADGGNNSFYGADIGDPGDRSDQDHLPNFSGTAAAAAHVAGAVALLRQRQGALTPAGVWNALASTASDMDDPGTAGFDTGFDRASGAGLVRADLAAAAVPRCGDGVPQAPEECDDGNTVDDDACGNDCLANICGDGVLHPANGEACDDGNDDDGDFCRNDCQPNFCGDGRVTSHQENLLVNGDFEEGTLAGWKALALGSGAFAIAVPGADTPLSRFPTADNPAGGLFCGLSDMLDAGTHALAQTFAVPATANFLQISFEMFVNDQSGLGPIIDPIGLDHTGPPNQHARVDLLADGSPPFTTGAGVLANLYLGVDAGSRPRPYTAYSFDLLGVLPPGGTYGIRFAEVDNQYFLHLGVDNVAVVAGLVEECDDGNHSDGDGCAADCTWEGCPAPAEVAGVRLLADGATLEWSPVPGASYYDVLRWEGVPAGGGPPGSESCVAPASTPPTATDPSLPPAVGSAFWYLVRAASACAKGPWGAASSGAPRVSTACP